MFHSHSFYWIMHKRQEQCFSIYPYSSFIHYSCVDSCVKAISCTWAMPNCSEIKTEPRLHSAAVQTCLFPFIASHFLFTSNSEEVWSPRGLGVSLQISLYMPSTLSLNNVTCSFTDYEYSSQVKICQAILRRAYHTCSAYGFLSSKKRPLQSLDCWKSLLCYELSTTINKFL